jgi:hypothetical protein
MTTLKVAVYVGPVEELKGSGAYIRKSSINGNVIAQFDNMQARLDGKDLAHGWHEFSRDDFKVAEELLPGAKPIDDEYFSRSDFRLAEEHEPTALPERRCTRRPQPPTESRS